MTVPGLVCGSDVPAFSSTQTLASGTATVSQASCLHAVAFGEGAPADRPRPRRAAERLGGLPQHRAGRGIVADPEEAVRRGVVRQRHVVLHVRDLPLDHQGRPADEQPVIVVAVHSNGEHRVGHRARRRGLHQLDRRRRPREVVGVQRADAVLVRSAGTFEQRTDRQPAVPLGDGDTHVLILVGRTSRWRDVPSSECWRRLAGAYLSSTVVPAIVTRSVRVASDGTLGEWRPSNVVPSAN